MSAQPKNMQKTDCLVRSGPATSFSPRHLALLWEALIIFYCFIHTKNMMKPELNVSFFLSYYSKHHKLFTRETQSHFLLKRSFLLSSEAQTSEPPWAVSSAEVVWRGPAYPASPPWEAWGFPNHHSPNAPGYCHQLLLSVPQCPGPSFSCGGRKPH